MKLKYLFLGLIGAAAFTACSNSDEPVVLGDTDAYLSIGVTDGMVKTKADPNAAPDESKIERLTAFVFNADGSALVTVADTAFTVPTTDYHIKHMKVRIKDYTGVGPSETTFKMVLVANSFDEVKGAKSIADLQDLLTTKSIENFNYNNEIKPLLPMASNVLKINTVKKNVENWITNLAVAEEGNHATGIPPSTYGNDDFVQMTRLISRVELESLTTDFKDGVYTDATFILDSVFLVNVRENAHFILPNVENTSAAYCRGSMASFERIQGIIYPSDEPAYILPSLLGKRYQREPSGVIIYPSSNKYDFKDKGNMFVSYIFPNDFKVAEPATPYATTLILKGEIVTTNQIRLSNRYFHITIKDVDKNEYVKPNTIYRINATINGVGSPNPDDIPMNIGISAKITVLDWKLVNQDVPDINPLR